MNKLRDWLKCFSPAVPWLLTAFLIVAVLLILLSALRPKVNAQMGGVQQPIFAPDTTMFYTDKTNVVIVDDNKYNAFGGLAQLPDKTLFCIYRSGSTHTSEDGVLNYRTSLDYGATWSDPTTLYDPDLDARDVEVVTLTNGTIFVSFFLWNGDDPDDPNGVYAFIGTNNGGGSFTFSSVITVTNSFTFSGTSSKALQRNDGTLYLPIYGKTNNIDHNNPSFVISTNAGATWGGHVWGHQVWTPYISTEEINEGCILYASNNVILGFFRYQQDVYYTNGAFLRSVSTDDGATWSNLGFHYYGCPARPTVLRLDNGTLVKYGRGADGPQTGPYYHYSWNEGVSWSDRVLAKTNWVYNYGSIIELDTGRIGLVSFLEPTTNTDICIAVYDEFVSPTPSDPGTLWNGNPASLPIGSPAISAYWVYTNMPTSGPTTNWPSLVGAQAWTQPLNTRYPTNTTTGVEFRATSWLTNASAPALGSNFTAVVTAKARTAPSNWEWLLNGSGSAMTINNSAGYKWIGYVVSASVVDTGGDVVTGRMYRLAWTAQGPADKNTDFYFDTTKIGTADSAATTLNWLGNAEDSTTYQFDGTVASVLIYTNTLSGANLTNLYGWSRAMFGK